jgi:hypothetical protein
MTAEPASVQFIGTATTLIRYANLTILTDPNFLHRGERGYLGYGLTAKRLTEPALDVTALPPLDGIVLSHLLFTPPLADFTDELTRRGLAARLREAARGDTVDLTDLVEIRPAGADRRAPAQNRRAPAQNPRAPAQIGRTKGGAMAEPSNPDEATNTAPVPQPARPVGSRPDSEWTAVSGTGDAEYGEPAAERNTPDRAFATSADSPLESDINQRIPDPAPAAEDVGVPDAEPSEDLAEGPPDGR